MNAANAFGVAKLIVLLEPIDIRYNEIVCRYDSKWQFNEFSFHEDDLEISSVKNRFILKKNLVVESVLNGMAVCKIEGYSSNLIVPFQNLEILEGVIH